MSDDKFEIIKKEAIRECIENMKEHAKYLKQPVSRIIADKKIIVYPDGKIYKDIDLNDFL